MKVKEIMTANPKTCDLNASLADAAKAMWESDCGILPVLKDGKEIVGVLTDRDICMGSAMRDRNPSGVSVEEVMNGELFSVLPEDDVQQALETMQQRKIRRLPVVDSEGELKGVLSMNDVVLSAAERGSKKASGISHADIVSTFQAICEHPLPMSTAANAP